MDKILAQITQLRQENAELKEKIATQEEVLKKVKELLQESKSKYNAANSYIEHLRGQLDMQCNKLDTKDVFVQCEILRIHEEVQRISQINENATKESSMTTVHNEVALSSAEISTKNSEPENKDVKSPSKTTEAMIDQTELKETSKTAKESVIAYGTTDSIYYIESDRTSENFTENNYKDSDNKIESLSIAESLKQAAEESVQQSGFVYDEKYGLYYDYNSGYYYDAEKSLYYEPHSGTYFYLDPDTNTYQFHSQVDVSQYYPDQTAQTQQTADEAAQDSWNQSTKDVSMNDLAYSISRLDIKAAVKNAIEQNSYQYPPCIRAMVKESDHLQLGTLFIITCTGATLGRESSLGVTIIVPDIQISKMHCDFQYNEVEEKYFIKDHGSQNGTFLNGKRLSEAKIISDPYPLSSGDLVTIGGTSLDLHIHPGTETCDNCEPGIVQAQYSKAKEENKEAYVIRSKAEKERLRRQEMKKIKKKYDLQNMDYIQNPSVCNNPKYMDKAEERRRTVGSDDPYQKDDAPASVDVAISSKNVGHKLLSKMGWKEGQSLGKTVEGIKEPVQVTLRPNSNAGLGSSKSQELSIDNVSQMVKRSHWAKASERYHKIEDTEKTE